ncbi:hypothetical protein, partial [Undibacterium sp.]|uniref:hypothetical protein n=1 Tax=Undibacterium sp. TaxID=1914977 RepID=UPI003753E4F4
KNTVSNENIIDKFLSQDAKDNPKLNAIARESSVYAFEYLFARSYEHSGLTDAGVTALGLARLNWLLHQGRLELIGLFTPSEFAVISSALEDEICGPGSILRLIGTVGYDLGLEPNFFDDSPHAYLMHKLLSLSSLQTLALRDLLEEYRHVAMRKMTCVEFLNKKGLI